MQYGRLLIGIQSVCIANGENPMEYIVQIKFSFDYANSYITISQLKFDAVQINRVCAFSYTTTYCRMLWESQCV